MCSSGNKGFGSKAVTLQPAVLKYSRGTDRKSDPIYETQRSYHPLSNDGRSFSITDHGSTDTAGC